MTPCIYSSENKAPLFFAYAERRISHDAAQCKCYTFMHFCLIFCIFLFLLPFFLLEKQTLNFGIIKQNMSLYLNRRIHGKINSQRNGLSFAARQMLIELNVSILKLSCGCHKSIFVIYPRQDKTRFTLSRRDI